MASLPNERVDGRFDPDPERCAWDYGLYYDVLRRGIAWPMRAGD